MFPVALLFFSLLLEEKVSTSLTDEVETFLLYQ